MGVRGPLSPGQFKSLMPQGSAFWLGLQDSPKTCIVTPTNSTNAARM